MDGAKPVQLGRQGSAITPVVRQSRKEPPEQALRHLAEGVLAQRIPRLEPFQPVDLPEGPRQVHVSAPSGEARAEKSPAVHQEEALRLLRASGCQSPERGSLSQDEECPEVNQRAPTYSGDLEQREGLGERRQQGPETSEELLQDSRSLGADPGQRLHPGLVDNVEAGGANMDALAEPGQHGMVCHPSRVVSREGLFGPS